MLGTGVFRKFLHGDSLKFHCPLKVFELNLDSVNLTIKIFNLKQTVKNINQLNFIAYLVPNSIYTSFQSISPLNNW